MEPPVVRAATPDDRPAVLTTLGAAFASDPMLRYLAPTDDAYARLVESFFGTLFDLRVDGGGVVRVTDDCAAASLWNPPGGNRHGPSHASAVWAERVTATLDAAELERHARFHDALDALHPAEPPHWYLGVVGVRPDRQGQGLGAAVIRSVLDEADRAGEPAYLVTATPGNVPIYERLGFVVRGEGEIAGGPHLWGMWRATGRQGVPTGHELH